MDFQKIFNQSNKKPQSILKIVLSISVVMLVLWLFLVSKVDTGNVTVSQQTEVQERTEGLKKSLIESKETANSVERKDSDDLFQNAFITFLIMIGGLGGVWFWAKKKGNAQNGYADKSPSREIGGHVFGPNAQLKFVEINEEVWVMAITENAVNLLHRVPKAEWKESELSTEAAKDTMPGKEVGKGDFKSLYKYFKN